MGSTLSDTNNPLFEFAVWRVTFLTGSVILIFLYILQVVNQEYTRRKFGKLPATIQLYGRPLLLFAAICFMIMQIDFFEVFGLLSTEAVVWLEFHFIIGIFSFLGVYIYVMTRSLEHAALIPSKTTSVITGFLFAYFIINGYLSTFLRVSRNQRWTIVYQNIAALIYVWSTIVRLCYAYIRLARLIRKSHRAREASTVERMESAITKWRTTIILIIAFTIVLTTLRLLPTRILIGEFANLPIPPMVEITRPIIIRNVFQFLVLVVYLYAVWGRISIGKDTLDTQDHPRTVTTVSRFRGYYTGDDSLSESSKFSINAVPQEYRDGATVHAV